MYFCPHVSHASVQTLASLQSIPAHPEISQSSEAVCQVSQRAGSVITAVISNIFELLSRITAVIADPTLRDTQYVALLLRDVLGCVGISCSDTNVEPDAWDTRGLQYIYYIVP
jgi:Ca2+/H+ antiporter